MINMIGPIIPAWQAAEMPNKEHPCALTICLASGTIEVFQLTQNPDGSPIVAISYDSEGYCAPVKGVLTDDAHQMISGYDQMVITNAAREYRIAKHSLVGVEMWGEPGTHEGLREFFARKCRDKGLFLAEKYNIAVDSIFRGRGYVHFDNSLLLEG